MSIICLSHVLSNNLSCYNNEYNINIQRYKNNESQINMPLHCGTHIDFPLHAVPKGKTSSDYNISEFVFYHPYIMEISPKGAYIQPQELHDIPTDVDFLIFKVLNVPERSSNEYALNNKGIGVELAKYLRLIFKNIRGVGINTISINAYPDKGPGRMAHKELLGSKPEILIIEDMKLDALKEGKLKRVIVSPLPVENADGVPVTVIAEVE